MQIAGKNKIQQKIVERLQIKTAAFLFEYTSTAIKSNKKDRPFDRS